MIAVCAAKFVGYVCKKMGRQGVTWAGKVAIKICPDILEQLSSQVRKAIFATCGTNGKTTTNNMLCAALEAEGQKVICNHTGSNMLNGVVAAFVLASKWNGKIDADYACIEADEASTRHIFPRIKPDYMLLTNLLEQNRIHCDEIQDAIIASVVPNVMHSLEGAVIKYLNIRPIVIEPGTKTGIRIVTENPRQIGADRIVDAAAAYEIYGGPVLVLDFGTATTYDLVDATGAFVSGVTAPGIRISAKALWEDAAKLPEIEIKKPDSILAKETITSMQAGLVYGQIGQTEYIVRHMKEEANLGEIKVVATGGLGRIIASETSMIDVYDPNLTLKGMNLIYKKQNRKSGRIKQA